MSIDAAQRRHEPVLRQRVMELLQPRSGGLYCDGTAGRGGHSEALLEASGPEGRLLALDRDPAAVAAVRQRLAGFGERAVVVHGRFGALRQVLGQAGWGCVDGLVLDLGVSSPQLDDGRRGLSFQQDGPIDMRLDPTTGETALEVIGRLGVEELARVIWEYGEERRSRRVARAIKRANEAGELSGTADLARVVRRAVGQRRAGRVDGATRTFQALRIYVNDELGELEAVLDDLPHLLAEGGRAVFLSFHSLEDRSVKRGLRRWSNCRCAPRTPQCVCVGPVLRPLTRKPLRPDEAEVERNPRARSARMRAAERLAVQLDEEGAWA